MNSVFTKMMKKNISNGSFGDFAVRCFPASHMLDPEVAVDFSKGKTLDLLLFLFSHESKLGMSLCLPQNAGIGNSKTR